MFHISFFLMRIYLDYLAVLQANKRQQTSNNACCLHCIASSCKANCLQHNRILIGEPSFYDLQLLESFHPNLFWSAEIAAYILFLFGFSAMAASLLQVTCRNRSDKVENVVGKISFSYTIFTFMNNLDFKVLHSRYQHAHARQYDRCSVFIRYAVQY